MFGFDPKEIRKEIRQANKQLLDELGVVNETLDDLNHNLKMMIDIEFEKLSKKQQAELSKKWGRNENTV